MELHLHHPRPPLSSYVREIRYLCLRPPLGDFTVVSEPSACTEIVVASSACMIDHDPSGLFPTKPRDFVFGPMFAERGATAYPPSNAGDETRVLSVVLLPGVLPALTRSSAHTFRDLVVPAAEIIPSSLLLELERFVVRAASPPPFDAVERALLRALDAVALPDPRAYGLLTDLAARPGEALVAVTSRFGLSSRQAERHFARYFGFSPKEFQRLYRFRKALGHIHAPGRGSREPLARVAVAAGYADHAHMTREFREFSGTSPSLYSTKRSSNFYLGSPPPVGFVQAPKIRTP